MGIVSLSLALHHPFLSQTRQFALSQSNWFRAPITTRTKPTSLSIIRAQSGARKEEIVIVGAGIAGLATALSLHRLGIGSIFLDGEIMEIQPDLVMEAAISGEEYQRLVVVD